MNAPFSPVALDTLRADLAASPRLLFIDGKFVPAASGETFEVIDPATGKVFAHAAAGDAADVDLAVKAARRAPRRRLGQDHSGAARPADDEARRPDRGQWRGAGAAGVARQRHADHDGEVRRGDGRVRTAALQCRLGDQDHRRDDRSVVAGRDAHLHVARARRRGRIDRALELPVRDGGSEDRAGAGGGLHDRAEARRADPAHRREAGTADRGSRLPGRARSTSSPASARRRARRSSTIPAWTRSASPAPPSRAAASSAPPRATSSASRWSWAASRRW